jgi:hypothetical protein
MLAKFSSRNRWKEETWRDKLDNIVKKKLKEIGAVGTEWIRLIQGMAQWRAVVRNVMTHPAP